jgi:hypothetical protein
MDESQFAKMDGLLTSWQELVSSQPTQVLIDVIEKSDLIDETLNWIESEPESARAFSVDRHLGDILSKLANVFRTDPLVNRLIWRMYEIASSPRARSTGQYNAGKHLYNAGLLTYLRGDHTTGLRLIVAALAEDIYRNPENWETISYAYRFLVAHGMGEILKAKLVASIDSMRKSAGAQWFPEDIVFFEPLVDKFVFDIAGQAGFNRAYWQHLVSRVKGSHANESEKGSALERLAVYLMSHIDGLRFVGRKVTTRKTEWDVLFRCVNTEPQFREIFGSYVVAECKNLQKPATSTAVRNFISKILSVRVNGGVLISLSGVSGNMRKNTNAWGEVTDAFRQHGITVVVLSGEDIDRLRTKREIYDLIIGRAEDVRFDRAVQRRDAS